MHHEELTFTVEEIDPSKERIFRTMGITSPPGAPGDIESLYTDAHGLYERLAAPRGMYKVISKNDFRDVFAGDGQNAAVTPVEMAYKGASSLALYVFTLGDRIGRYLQQLMRENEYPLGFILDAIASESADKASAVAEVKFNEQTSTPRARTRTLLYSPGYCGWHLTAQRKLFEHLHPESIGVTLNDSCMMMPTKSVSGVLVAGKPSIHRHGQNFEFCPECRNPACRLGL